MNDNDNNRRNVDQSRKMISPSLIAGMTIRVEIFSGKDLVPKDRPNRSIFTGMKRLPAKTSDPYVKVRYKGDEFGKTRVIPKNCQNPEWNETIQIEINANQARNLLQQIYDSPYCNQSHNTATTTSSSNNDDDSTSVTDDAAAVSIRQAQILLGLPTIDCFIYDKDILSFDDPMGIVQIPITPDHVHYDTNSISASTTGKTSTTNSSFGSQWYTVCTNQVICDSSNNYTIINKEFCSNGTGELYMNIQIESQWMMHIQNHSTDIQKSYYSFSPSPGRYDIEIAWNTTTTTEQSNKNVETLIDTACIAIDERNGKVNMENCVFYHNLVNPNGSIRSRADIVSTSTSSIPGQNLTTTKKLHTETYTVTESLIPTNIQMFYFAVFASQPQQYLTNEILSSMTLRITDSATKIGICAYTLLEYWNPTDRNNDGTALVMAQFVRHPNMDQNPNDRRTDIWSIQPVPHETLATYDTGRDFGTILPELKQLVSESKLFPNIILHPNEIRIGLVRKGGVIRLNDYIHQQQNPEHHAAVTVVSDEYGWNFACRCENSTIHQINQQRQVKAEPEPALKYEMHALLFSGEDNMDFNFQCIEQIHVNHPQSNLDQSVRMGDKMLDQEEYMSVRLSKLPKYVTVVAFTMQLQQLIPLPGGEGFGELQPTATSSYWNHVNQQISFHIRHPITNQVIAKYQQSVQSTLLLQNSTFVACLYRTKKSSLIARTTKPSNGDRNDDVDDDDDEWYFHVVDESMNRSTNSITESARNIVEKLYSILHCNNSPMTATKIAKEEQDIVF